MDALIVELYYHLDEHLKPFVKPQAQINRMSDAEVLLVSVVAAHFLRVGSKRSGFFFISLPISPRS